MHNVWNRELKERIKKILNIAKIYNNKNLKISLSYSDNQKTQAMTLIIKHSNYAVLTDPLTFIID